MILIATGIIDLFMTVLYYDEAGPLLTRLCRIIWATLKSIAARVPQKHAGFVLSLGVPVMVLTSVLFWVALQMVGFAMLYYVGFQHGAFQVSEALGTDAYEAIYLSSITLSGLGYGDISPASSLFQMITSIQALLGYGFLTLAIAYVVNVYQVIREMGVLSSDIYHESQRTYEARHILELHFHKGQPRGLEGRLKSFYYSMITHHEGMRHYPFVYYFYSRRGYAALPYRFGLIAKVIAGLRWGLPSTHPVTSEPWVLALKSAYESITDEIRDRFLPPANSSKPSAVGAEQFASEMANGHSADPFVRPFLELQDFMESLVEDKINFDPDESYARYCEWMAFISRSDDFLQASYRNLGPRTR